jgi:hypothetical protein
MDKKMIVIGVVALLVIFSGCATQKRYMLSSTHPGKNGYIVIKNNVQGFAKANYLFGFGSFAKRSLMNEAKAQLIESNHLNGNQALVNLKVNWKMINARPFLVTNRCTVTADIVEFKQNQSAFSMATTGN